ncbi:MAG: hypothetical protein FWE02_02850 [Defluviitaleaceae bacterium]|nr:hypothetical protein [Defluviitaleaceae bacterium]
MKDDFLINEINSSYFVANFKMSVSHGRFGTTYWVSNYLESVVILRGFFGTFNGNGKGSFFVVVSVLIFDSLEREYFVVSSKTQAQRMVL